MLLSSPTKNHHVDGVGRLGVRELYGGVLVMAMSLTAMLKRVRV